MIAQSKLNGVAKAISDDIDMLRHEEARKVALALLRDGISSESGSKLSCGPAKHNF
jgi:hypothetical protein